MPGVWYDSEQDPDHYAEFVIKAGDLIEIGVYDDDEEPQGAVLTKVFGGRRDHGLGPLGILIGHRR